MRHGRIPDAQAVAAAAQVGPHDVEAEEREALVVIHAGDGCGRRPVEFADEKALRVDGGEAGGIGATGIPALGHGPVGGEPDLVWPHGSNMKSICLGHDRYTPHPSCAGTARRKTRVNALVTRASIRFRQKMDCAILSVPSRVNPTWDVKPGNDRGSISTSRKTSLPD